MENNEIIILEDCPICRGAGMIVHEGGWTVQVECNDCSAHTVYVDYGSEEEKAEAEKTVARLKEYINYIDEIAEVLAQIANGKLAIELKYAYT